MSHRITFATVLLFGLLGQVATLPADEPDPDLKKLVVANTEFAFDLYSRLRTDSGNILVSPYCVSSVLAMACAGASGNTEKEMSSALHFSSESREMTHFMFRRLNERLRKDSESGNPEITIAESLWSQQGYPLRPEYLSLMRTNYGALVTPLDYASDPGKARIQINNWISRRTNERIRDIIRPGDLNRSTRLVLVNAISFRAKWAVMFDADKTASADFRMLDGTSRPIPMMQRKGMFSLYENDSLQVLELPCEGGTFSMIVVLPRDPMDLPRLESSLAPGELEHWRSGMSERLLHAWMPRFSIRCGTMNLESALTDMGMVDAFSRDANFSGMDESKSLFLDAVLHKAQIEVNEEGTEASAAAVVPLTKGPRLMSFRADRPFLLLIRDRESGTILFMGRFVEPES